MISNLCLGLLIVAVVCHWSGRVRVAGICLSLSVVLILLSSSGLIARILLPLTQMSSRVSDVVWRPGATIVLVGSGTFDAPGAAGRRVHLLGHSTLIATAQAHRACEARLPDCPVIVTGAAESHADLSEARTYASVLADLGVPQADIVLEERSKNTWQNAKYSDALVPQGSPIIIVATGLHLRRSLQAFHHFRTDVQGVSSDMIWPDIGMENVSIKMAYTDMIAHELVGTWGTRVKTALGLDGNLR